MSLWTDRGDGWQKVGAALLRVDTRAPAFLCCPGPSLAEVTGDLRGPGRIVYAINSAYPKIQPDCWLGLDRLACHHPHIWFEAFPKITRHVKGDTVRARHCPNVYYADLDAGGMRGMFVRRDADTSFLWEHSTFLFALHFLLWCGHKTVFLVGSDMGGPRDYHDERVLSEKLRACNHRLHDRQVALLRELAPLAARHGVQWVSCTPASRLNEFLPFMPLEAALARCTDGLPEMRPLLHSMEADGVME